MAVLITAEVKGQTNRDTTACSASLRRRSEGAGVCPSHCSPRRRWLAHRRGVGVKRRRRPILCKKRCPELAAGHQTKTLGTGTAQLSQAMRVLFGCG